MQLKPKHPQVGLPACGCFRFADALLTLSISLHQPNLCTEKPNWQRGYATGDSRMIFLGWSRNPNLKRAGNRFDKFTKLGNRHRDSAERCPAELARLPSNRRSQSEMDEIAVCLLR